jgi:hypothetical protein
MADWLAIHWIMPSCRLLLHPLPPGSRTIQEGPYVRIDEGSHLLATAGDHTLLRLMQFNSDSQLL